MERKRKEMPWAVLTTSTDPFLEPLRPVFGEVIRFFPRFSMANVFIITTRETMSKCSGCIAGTWFAHDRMYPVVP